MALKVVVPGNAEELIDALHNGAGALENTNTLGTTDSEYAEVLRELADAIASATGLDSESERE
jgi:hypothetical protein